MYPRSNNWINKSTPLSIVTGLSILVSLVILAGRQGSTHNQCQLAASSPRLPALFAYCSGSLQVALLCVYCRVCVCWWRVCCLNERSSSDQQKRIGLSLYVACDGGGSSPDTTTQLLWCVAWTQASRCLLLVPLAFCLNQLIECERPAGLDDMKDNTQGSGSFKKSFCVCLCTLFNTELLNNSRPSFYCR